MLSKEDIRKLKEQYNKMNSPESQEYTKKVLLEMGKFIERNFPGVEFELKARYKSEKSFEGKVERLNKNPKKGKQIYDNIGFCLIVKSVSDNFDFNHKLCRKKVNERTRVGQSIDNQKSSLTLEQREIDKKILKIKKDIEEANGNLREETIQVLKTRIEELKRTKTELESKFAIFEEMANKYYYSIDNEINEMISTHIMNKFMDDDVLMNDLDLKKILGKTKNHDGGKSGYYIAFHDAVKSKKLDYWMVDLHSMSYENYQESQKDHSQAEGKERIFPRLSEENFKKLVLRVAPRNLIYQNGKYKDGQEIVPGRIYECSEIENVVYYFTETLKNNQNTFKYIISDSELFNGAGKLIEGNKRKMVDKEVKEDEMEI